MNKFFLGLSQRRARLAQPALCTALALAIGIGFSGCHKGGSGGSTSGLTSGSLSLLPGQGGSSVLSFVVQPNQGGNATSLHLRAVRWGRLADIRDGDKRLRHTDFLVDENAATNSDFTVEINPVSEKTTITINYPFSTDPASQYAVVLAQLEGSLTALADKSLDPNELPPFPLVPRNAAVVLEFDDLLDSNTINAQTIKILKGYPPVTPFDARIIPDPNHGDLADTDGTPGLEFHTTRIIIDPTVSQLEAVSTNPPLPVNSLGLPASITAGQPNIAVRIPTKKVPTSGQVAIVQNLAGRGLTATGNGSLDTAVATRDVVRALRSGGTLTLDANNGFLTDLVPPSVLGTQGVGITTVTPGPIAETFVCELDYALSNCGLRLTAGDVIQQGGVFAEVICPPGQTCAPGVEVTGDLVGPHLTAVNFRVIASEIEGQTLSTGLAQVSIRYRSSVPSAKVPCFVRFPSIGLPPNQNVAPDSPVTVRFTEPMDPKSLTAFDSFLLLRRDPAPPLPAQPPTLTAYDYVVGGIVSSTDLREFTFQPQLPLTHVSSATETYYAQVTGGVNGPTDLAGNPLATDFPRVPFSLAATAAAQNTNGFALRFSTADEIAGIGGSGTAGVGKKELRGQFLIDFDQQVIRPRPVTHFSAACDRTQAVPANMPPFGPGVQTPLSKLGSKLQQIWRYCDVGFSLLDEATTNVDLEGLDWSPVGGAVVADNYQRFEMGLTTSNRLPDESLDPNLLPLFPNSGLVVTYAQNILDAANDPLRTVYPVPTGPTGYNVDPFTLFQGPTGTNFVPWPFNRNLPLSKFAFYTWRNTAVLAKGALLDSPGAELPIVNAVNGFPAPPTPLFPPGTVPTIGLPLLMEFRCYPDDGALGLNAFDISIATASSARPNFRAFSTGGTNTANQTIRKDPDLEFTASGGFNPTSTPTPGAVTPGADNALYMGQMELVVRVSRLHTIWFDSNAVATPVAYSPPVLEPLASEQPDGTQVILEFRGATNVTDDRLKTDATLIDAYGEPRVATNITPAITQPTFFNSDRTWKSSLISLNTARFFQVRITFVSNAETNLTPELSALAFAYRF